MAYDKFTYTEDARSMSTPRWYDKNPAIDSPLATKTYLGIVRDSRDPQRMGRLLVWIPELTGDANNVENWIICHYCTPFGGASFPNSEYYRDIGKSNVIDELYDKADAKAKKRTPEKKKDAYGGRQSYGMWFPPPDVGNEVVITFVNGDVNYAVWVGAMFQQDMNHMVPGIAENQIFDGVTSTLNDEIGPVIEPDYTQETDNDDNANPRKLKYEPLYNGLKFEQGLNDDRVRGQSSSSARREAPSEVFGILTPDGNQFVMDDKENHEFIRLRTKGGAQLLINQTDGMIFAISRDGRSWIELSNEGNIDVYGSESISIHAEKAHVNLKAGQDINLQAKRNINIRSGGDFKLEVGGKIDIVSDDNLTANSKKRVNIGALTEMAITSTGAMGITSAANMNLQGGPNVFLNSGTGPIAAFSETPSTYKPSSPSTNIEGEPWVSGEPYLEGENIIPRVPQHEPWIEHKISTTGTNNHIIEGPLNPRIPTGATTENATKPNDVTLPNGERLEGKSITPSGQPEYIQQEDVPACALEPMSQRQIDQAGLDHIKQSEGVRNTVYKDQAGLDTIGVGHLITKEEKASGRFASGRISDEEVDALLLEDLDRTQRGVRNCVKQPVTQEQYDAMVSMAFNIGVGGFCNSTLVKKINAGEYKEVPNQMMRWNKITVGGVVTESAGLTSRRRAEANLFAKAPAPC